MNRHRLMMTLLLMYVISITTLAQNAVTIYQKDGQMATFAFSEKPMVTYSGNDLVLTTNSTTVMYSIYMLKKISFDVEWPSPTGIEEVEVKAKAQFSFQGGTLYISGGMPGSLVYIYNIKGLLMGQYKIDDSGFASIPLHQLRRDVFIVKAKDFTFKFRKP